MNASMSHPTGAGPIVRWVARIAALVCIGFLLAFVIGEGFSEGVHPGQITPWEWVQLLFFPVGVGVGMALGWWKETWGGLLAIGCLIVFYLLHFLASGSFPRGPYFALFTSPAVLYLISAWMNQ